MSQNHRDIGSPMLATRSVSFISKQIVRDLALRIIVPGLAGAGYFLIAHYLGEDPNAARTGIAIGIGAAVSALAIYIVQYLWGHGLQPTLKRLGLPLDGELLFIWLLVAVVLGTIIGGTVLVELRN